MNSKQHHHRWEKMAPRVARKLLQWQAAFVHRVSVLTNHWSPRQWKIALIVFCTGAFISNAYFITKALTPSHSYHPVVVIDHVTRGHTTPPAAILKHKDALIALDRIDKLLDSLATHAKPAYDSMMVLRPGLKDSVAQMKQIYMNK